MRFKIPLFLSNQFYLRESIMSSNSKDKEQELERRKAFDYLAGAERNPELVSLVTANKGSEIELDGKDILALFIAMLQTVFSPILILILVLVGFTLFFRILQFFITGM